MNSRCGFLSFYCPIVGYMMACHLIQATKTAAMFAVRRAVQVARTQVRQASAVAAAPKANAEVAALEEKAKGPWNKLSVQEKVTRTFFLAACLFPPASLPSRLLARL